MGDYTSSNGMSGDVNHARNPPTQKDPSSKPQSRDSYRLAQELNDLHIKVIISFKHIKKKILNKMLRFFFALISFLFDHNFGFNGKGPVLESNEMLANYP